MISSFQILALSEEVSKKVLDKGEGTWVDVTAPKGFPCRISLVDAKPGEKILLSHITHHDVGTPYRAAGPVYLRPNVPTAKLGPNELPKVFAGRLLSFRAYTEKGFMADAQVAPGENAKSTIESLFENKKVAYIHVHFAAPGCFCCEVKRLQ